MMRLRSWQLFSVGIGIGLCLLVVRAYHQQTIQRDDGISLLAATCHQAVYANNLPEGEWVAAGEWQRFWTPEQLGCFGVIRNDLALYDIHPPLYFWLLHLWLHATGLQLFLIPWLNILFQFLTMLLMVVLCQRLDVRPAYAIVAALLWLWSDATLTSPFDIRPYSLLGLAVVVFMLSLVSFVQRPRSGGWAVAGATWLGLLIHYNFLLVMGFAGVGVLVLLGIRREWRRAAHLLMAFSMALALFVALHPQFLHSFQRQQDQAQALARELPSVRAERFIASLLQLELPPMLAQPLSEAVVRWWLPLLFGLVLLLGVYFFRQPGIGMKLFSVRWLPGTVALALVLTQFVLYVLHLNPAHAIGPRYNLLFSPLLYVAVGQWLERFPERQPISMLVMSALLGYGLLYGTAATAYRIHLVRQAAPPSYLTPATPIILDSTQRGVLPTILWHAPPQAPVYAAFQDQLLRDFPSLPEEPATLFYISDVHNGNSEIKQRQILARFESVGYCVAQNHGSIYGVATVFELHQTQAARCSPQSGESSLYLVLTWQKAGKKETPGATARSLLSLAN